MTENLWWTTIALLTTLNMVTLFLLYCCAEQMKSWRYKAKRLEVDCKTLAGALSQRDAEINCWREKLAKLKQAVKEA